MVTALAALAVAAVTGYLGRRDVTRPAVVFGVVWFGCVALAQIRLTQIETPWATGFTILVFAGGLAFMAAAVLGGGTLAARGRIVINRDAYQPRRLVLAALVLFAGGLAGVAYKASVLGGLPLLSGHADDLRANAFRNGQVAVPAWSSALTDGFFLAMWCALLALWLLRGKASRLTVAGLSLLAAASLFGVALLASRNTILFAIAIPLIAAYLLTPPDRRIARARVLAAVCVVLLVGGGLFVARLSEHTPGRETFLDIEMQRQKLAVRPVVPFYINAVYPLEADSRLYRVVPDQEPYLDGGASLFSLPDAAFPHGKPPFGATLVSLMRSEKAPGLGWSVATYQGRLLADAGWQGVVLGSLLLGLAFGALYRWARARRGLVPVVLVGYLAYYTAFMVYDNLLSFSIIAVYDLGALALVALYSRRQVA
jgi:hypothetical protein